MIGGRTLRSKVRGAQKSAREGGASEERRKTGRTTRIETRYGCFLPDLTGLARDPSAASLPAPYIGASAFPRKGGCAVPPAAFASPRLARDRKSTRLNSSHQCAP